MLYIKKQILRHALVFTVFLFATCPPAKADSPSKSASLLGFKVVKTYPHDTGHYTEGLVFLNGKLLESAGQYGQSGLYEVDLKSGKAVRSRQIDAQFFAEGIAAAQGKIVQLTWKEGTAFVYNLNFDPVRTLNYSGEGWGLASFNNETQLVMSDGTPILRFLDASDYHQLRQITVRDGGREVMRLNELEAANGLIYANVWLSDMIAVIDPADGHVVNWLDLSSLQNLFKKPDRWNPIDNVLNGIAFNPRNGHFYVTGKNWPALFEISIDGSPRKR